MGGRSIPTGVGKTFGGIGVNLAVAVHPHGCGENHLPELQESKSKGPSPRVWGKPLIYTRIQAEINLQISLNARVDYNISEAVLNIDIF